MQLYPVQQRQNLSIQKPCLNAFCTACCLAILVYSGPVGLNILASPVAAYTSVNQPQRLHAFTQCILRRARWCMRIWRLSMELVVQPTSSHITSTDSVNTWEVSSSTNLAVDLSHCSLPIRYKREFF
jgi:hypothetical protein